MARPISLSAQELPVKCFLESLATDPEGVVVEVGDRRAFIIVRPAVSSEQLDEPWTDAKNRRRANLIDKEIDGTITPMEVVELADLQQHMYRFVDTVAPLPLGDVQQLQKRLLRKATATVARRGTGA